MGGGSRLPERGYLGNTESVTKTTSPSRAVPRGRIGFDVLPGSSEGGPLCYRYFIPEGPIQGRVLLVHGVSEHGGRYEHVMRHLGGLGIASLIGDHRGHGRNTQHLAWSPDMQRLAADLGAFRAMLIQLSGEGPLSIWGHSMGGLVTLLHLCHHQHEYQSAVLSSAASGIPERIPKTLIHLAPILGRLLSRVGIMAPNRVHRLTRDPEIRARTKADPLMYSQGMRAGTGAAILRGIRRIQPCLPSIELPVLITHGDDDTIVPVELSFRLRDLIGSSDKTLRIYSGWQHELHNEIERDSYLQEVSSWLSSRWCDKVAACVPMSAS